MFVLGYILRNACIKQMTGKSVPFAKLGVWFTGIGEHKNPIEESQIKVKPDGNQ